MRLKLIFILSCLYCFNPVFSQFVNIEGVQVTVQQNASVTIQGSLIAEINGNFMNRGNINISKDIVNNSSTVLFLNDLPGEVTLNGDNQLIEGADSISFYDLSLAGGILSEKELKLSVSITNVLDLNDQVLETHTNKAYVLNPSTNAILYNNGFAASDSLGGYLIRVTNTPLEYIVPVGALNLYPNIRPVTITPHLSDTNMYGVRLAPINVGLDNTGTSASGAVGPFYTSQRESSITSPNNKFYHNIFKFNGTSAADIGIYYDSFDGEFKTIAQWKNNIHKRASFQKLPISRFGLDRVMTKEGVNDFNNDVFTLVDLIIDIKVPNGVSVNGDGLNDLFVIKELEYFPNNKLIIFNRWGDVIYEQSPYLNDWSGQVNVNGTFLKNEAVAGTYYYLLYTDKEKDEEPLKGFIELKK